MATLCAFSSLPVLAAGETYQLPGMTVSDQSMDTADRYVLDPTATSITAPDTAALLKRVPGANVNANGSLSGIAQYRGLFGTRLNVSVDGVYVNSGGPNWMDPPLHYAPRPLVESLEVVRGIAPVSAGNETFGGYIVAHTLTSQFTASDEFEVHGRLNGGGQTVNDGYSAGGLVSLANRRHRMHVLGSHEEGEDTEFGGGKVRPSEYERDNYGAGYGLSTGPHELAIDYRRNETGDTGTPALPMDIVYFNTDIWRGEYQGAWGDVSLEGRLYYTDVEHKMSNFTLRTAPLQRLSLAESDGLGYELHAGLPLAGGELSFGADGHRAEHDVDIFDRNNPNFFVNNYRDIERDRYGLFVQWDGSVAEAWDLELGLRYTRVDADAGTVNATPALGPGGPQTLRDRFNAADRDKSDNNLEWVAKLRYHVDSHLDLELGAARKVRSPSYQERYLWLPLESTAGLADGNRYVGNIGLDPEVSHQIELGLDWHTRTLRLSPRLFYRRVDDYIQGTPSSDPVVIAVSTVNGDPNPLQFNNVDAKLYGVDLDWGYVIHPNWHVDGVLSFVRGERRDIDDDLYRISPLNTTLALTYERSRWALTAEGVFYARQDRVSKTNEELKTAGYGILNLYGHYELAPGLSLTAGVGNVFDRRYANHLGGLNRVAGDDLRVGERIPGPGRDLHASLSYSW